jgi:hypothetical protein
MKQRASCHEEGGEERGEGGGCARAPVPSPPKLLPISRLIVQKGSERGTISN